MEHLQPHWANALMDIAAILAGGDPPEIGE
jgi:hypothetical protein